MTFADIKADIRINLNDAGVTAYSVADIDDAVQDAYDDIVFHSHCIIKSVNLPWQSNSPYYDFAAISVTDYMGCTAIFNNNNNLWLDDNTTRQQLRNEDPRWEVTLGEPILWLPINFRYIAVYPHGASSVGTFDLKYWAKAPTVVDADTPLIAADMQDLVTFYATADLLEQWEEYTKARVFWEEYIGDLEDYKERVENIAKAELMLI